MANANRTVTSLPPVAAIEDDDVFYLVQGGDSRKATGAQIKTFIAPGLDELADVNAASPASGDVLIWDGGASEWVAAPVPGSGEGGTVPDGGTTGQILSKASGVDQDTAWVPAARTLIAETVANGSTSNVQFNSIPATFRDLELRIRGRGTTAATTVAVNVTFNNDTGGNYDWERVSGSDATASANGGVAASSFPAGGIAGASSSANVADAIRIEIFDYRGTTFQKALHVHQTTKTGTASRANLENSLRAGWWRDTSAINRVDVILGAGNFASGSVVSLYGLM